MKKKHPIIIGLIVVIVPILIGQVMMSKRDPQPPLPLIKKQYAKRPPNPILQKVIHDYEEKLGALVDKAQTPGLAVAIVHDSTIVFMKGFGVRAVGKPDSINENTVFRLASV